MKRWQLITACAASVLLGATLQWGYDHWRYEQEMRCRVQRVMAWAIGTGILAVDAQRLATVTTVVNKSDIN